MSRSYKKNPLKQIGDKTLKKLYNRRLRRRKQLDYPSNSAYKREPNNNQWDLCDYVVGYFSGDEIDEPRKYRYYNK